MANEASQIGEFDEEIYRLDKIKVEEVHLVDRGANKQRKFLIVKRDGTVNTDDNTDPDRDIAKQKLTIPKPVKATVERILTEASERVMSLGNQVKDAEETDEEVDRPLPAAIDREAKAIMALLGSIGEKYPSPTAKSDGMKDDVTKKSDNEKTISDKDSADPGGDEKPKVAKADSSEAAELMKMAGDASSLEEVKAHIAKLESQASEAAKLATRVSQLEQERMAEQFASLKKQAQDEGKLAPSQEEWFDGLDYEVAKSWLASAPVIMKGRTPAKKGAPDGEYVMSDVERKAMQIIGGVSEEQWITTRKAEIKKRAELGDAS